MVPNYPSIPRFAAKRVSQKLPELMRIRHFDCEMSSWDFHQAENTQLQVLARVAVENEGFAALNDDQSEMSRRAAAGRGCVWNERLK